MATATHATAAVAAAALLCSFFTLTVAHGHHGHHELADHHDQPRNVHVHYDHHGHDHHTHRRALRATSPPKPSPPSPVQPRGCSADLLLPFVNSAQQADVERQISVTGAYLKQNSLGPYAQGGGASGRRKLLVPDWAGPVTHLASDDGEPRIPPGNFANASVTIGVVMHVIYGGAVGDESTGYLPLAKLYAQMDELNRVYNEFGFAFKLLNVTYNYGNCRTKTIPSVIDPKCQANTTSWYYMSVYGAGEYYAKKTLRQDSGYYDDPTVLQLFYASTNALGGNVLGWSTFPWFWNNPQWQDGCTVLSPTVPGGGYYPYNMGATTIHEVGHWLGLYHPFNGGCKSDPTQGDFVDDTPAEAVAAYFCTPGRDSCPAPAGDTTSALVGTDAIHNYMDYSSDSCMTGFSPNQIVRMWSSWYAYRSNVKAPPPPPPSPPAAPGVGGGRASSSPPSPPPPKPPSPKPPPPLSPPPMKNPPSPKPQPPKPSLPSFPTSGGYMVITTPVTSADSSLTSNPCLQYGKQLATINTAALTRSANLAISAMGMTNKQMWIALLPNRQAPTLWYRITDAMVTSTTIASSAYGKDTSLVLPSLCM